MSSKAFARRSRVQFRVASKWAVSGLRLATAIGVLLGCFSSSALCLVINGENAEENYRFASGYPGSPVPNLDPDFVAAGYDLSGIGWSSTNQQQSFVMINDQYFLYATHFPPSTQINFFNGSVVSYAVDTSFTLRLEYPFQAPGNHLLSDLSVGRLTTPLSPSDNIATYPILFLPSLSDYNGLNLLVYGWDAAVGTGVIDGTQGIDLYNNNSTLANSADDYLAPDGLNDTFTMRFIQGAAAGEALLESGDSGSPSFTVWNGGLALVGTHSAIASSSPTSFDAFVPAYLNSLAAAGITFSVVPEPSAIWCFGIGLLFATAARRLRR